MTYYCIAITKRRWIRERNSSSFLIRSPISKFRHLRNPITREQSIIIFTSSPIERFMSPKTRRPDPADKQAAASLKGSKKPAQSCNAKPERTPCSGLTVAMFPFHVRTRRRHRFTIAATVSQQNPSFLYAELPEKPQGNPTISCKELSRC